MRSFILLLVLVILKPLNVAAAECTGNPEALGTSRILVVDPRIHPRIGRKQFPQTLPLAVKEVVLTFDDGPEPSTTPRVLEALRRHCVKATFFLIGRNVVAHPEIARQIAAAGHSIGHHTYSHPLLSRMSPARAELDISRGLSTIEAALGHPGNVNPFFRFPGFASSPALLKLMESRGSAVFGADVWASDWNPMTPQQELHLLMTRIEASHGGIVLLHDTKKQTAAMLPSLLNALRQGGYRVVHIVAPK